MLRHMYKSLDNLCLTQESDSQRHTGSRGQLWDAKQNLAKACALHTAYFALQIPPPENSVVRKSSNVKETAFYSN